MATDAETLVLVDGSALAFRSFYALFTSGLRKSDGTATWAVYGFLNSIFDLLETRKPDMVAVCFDLAEPTFRHKEYEDYKANRAEMPDDLATQWPMIKEAVEYLDIPILEKPGFEADDIIGTLARIAEQKKMNVQILTGDQDAFQLLDGHIQVLMPGKNGLATFGRGEVFEKLSVWPEQIVDYKALCGDSSDNIPGVRGIGPKTAVQLLTEFQTLENVYANIDKIKSKSVQQKLIDGKDSAFASQNLATIRLDVDIDIDFEKLKVTMPEVETLAKALKDFEFKNMLKRLPKILASFNNGVEPVIDESLLTMGTVQTKPAKTNGDAASVSAPGQQLTLGVVSTTAPEPIIVTTESQLEDLVKQLSKQEVISVDLETTGLASLDTQIVGYAFAWADEARMKDCCVSSSKDNWNIQTAYVPVRHFGSQQLPQELVSAKLKPVLEDQKIGKVAQNAKYEMNVLSLDGIKFGPVCFDPLLASYIVDPDEKHGLKDQAERILGHQMVKIAELIGTGKKQLTMEQVPISQAAPYAADDARMTLELARYYSATLNPTQFKMLTEMDMPLSAVLAKMEQNGVALDLGYLGLFSMELTQDLSRLELEIFEDAGHSFNINSPQQLQKVLFEELKLPVKSKTKSGYSTDASVLESLKNEHPIISKLMDFRQMSKLRSTYVDALPRQVNPRDKRLHGDFNQTGTSTGRLSSSNPNLQNIPIRTELGRRIRRAFIPANDSNVLISADYSQIELRLLAQMCGDEILLEAFQKDEDIHARTAAEIFDKDINAVDSDMRRVGKTINFSLIYQQGAYSTGLDLGVTTKEAQAFIDKYFSRYPKVRKYLTDSIEDARSKGYAETIWGRKRYFRNLNDRNDMIRKAEERAACNAPLQGSAADLMKLAMIDLDKELTKRQLKTKLILQVHDELVLDVPKDELEEVTRLVHDAMSVKTINGEQFRVPLKVDIRSGKNWMEAK